MNREFTGRAVKILSRFPSFMRAEGQGKVLGEIARTLGGDLDVELADFFILRMLYEKGLFDLMVENPVSDQEREERAYALYLDQLKESVVRIVRLMQDGCGTIWALLEGASILINADTLIDPEKGTIEHIDADKPRGGFIHRINIKYTVIEEGDTVEKTGYIYMVENPITDKVTDEKERWQREFFSVKRGGFFDGPVSIKVTGVGERTVRPMIINKSTHEGVGFRGNIAEGQRLVFTFDGKAYLEEEDVTPLCYYFKGGLADNSPFQGGAEDAPNDGTDTKHHYCRVQPPGSLDRNYPRPEIEPLTEIQVLTLLLGKSDWRFSTEEGAFDASGFDKAVFALPEDQTTMNALPPSGKVQMAWQEHEPFAVAILIPNDLQSIETSLLEGQDLRKLVRAGLERFRTAGIRVSVDYFDEKWISEQDTD
jgi:hypothetical protein